MRFLWTFVKVVVGLALLVPISIIVLSTALGILGALVGLAVLTLRLAVFGLIAFAVFKLGVMIFGGRKQPEVMPIRDLPRVDPYYEAAKRELDEAMGERTR